MEQVTARHIAPQPRGKFAAPGFESLVRVFESQIEQGLHAGAQICVRRGTELLCDWWGGIADTRTRRPVTCSTPFMVYSATKALTAIMIHMLADRGALDLDAPVAHYWPAFARNGKEKVTIAHVLLHQSGIPGKATLGEVASWLVPGLPEHRVSRMCPIHRPGEKAIYHPFTGGFVLGELIRRATGISPASFARKKILEPLGMHDLFPGLPLSRQAQASCIYTSDPEQASAARLFSLPLYRRLFLPAASLNTTAWDLCTFYSALAQGGTLGTMRLISSRQLEEATQLCYDGPDGDTGRWIKRSLGFSLGGYSQFPDKNLYIYGRASTIATFGHSGQGGCAIGWADPPSGLSFAFVCNGFLDMEGAHRRFEALADEVWQALAR